MTDCPIPGCTRTTRPGELLCGPHWQQVPYERKTAVWSTWRAFTKAVTQFSRLAARQPWLDARAAAIASVSDAESTLS